MSKQRTPTTPTLQLCFHSGVAVLKRSAKRMTTPTATGIAILILIFPSCSNAPLQSSASAWPLPDSAKTRQVVRLLQAIYVRPENLRIDPNASEFRPIQADSTLTARLIQIRSQQGDIAFTFDVVEDGAGTTARLEGIVSRSTDKITFRGDKPNYGEEPILIGIYGNFRDPNRPCFVLHHYFVLHQAIADPPYDHFYGSSSGSRFTMTRTGTLGE